MPRRRLGVLRTAKKAAVISGSATAASQLIKRRERERLLAQEAARSTPASPPNEMGQGPTTPNGIDMVGSLERLAGLRASGALSEKEFAAAKAKLLAT